MAVRIVTDSTCDLPPDLIEAHRLTVVPLTVSFGEEALLDGVDIQAEAFYARMKSFDGLPRTSQPTVQRFKETYEPLLAAGHDIVSIHISARLSGTLNSARLAVEQRGANARVELVDSGQVSLGLGAVVLEAAEAVARGATAAEVAAVARAASPRVQIIAAVDTLEYLRRGGRIGRAQSMLGSLLSIKPLIRVEDGELAPFEKVRTHNRAIERLIELATADRTLKRLLLGSAANDASLQRVLAGVTPLLPDTDIVIGTLGPVVGAHSGPGLTGICTVKQG